MQKKKRYLDNLQNTCPYLQKSSGTFLIEHKKYCTALTLYKNLVHNEAHETSKSKCKAVIPLFERLNSHTCV